MILDKYNLFWLGPNHFSWVQIKIFWTDFYNLDLTKTNWDTSKMIGWYSTKIIWTVQNNFRPIEGQGINAVLKRIFFHLVTLLIQNKDKSHALKNIDL